MFELLIIIGLLLGVSLGWLLTGLRLKPKLSVLQTKLDGSTADNRRLQSELAAKDLELRAALQDLGIQKVKSAELMGALQTQTQLHEERLGLLAEAQHKMETTFKALASDTLKSNTTSFLELARSSLGQMQDKASTDLINRQQAINDLLIPIKSSLSEVDQKISGLEKERISAYSGLTEQVKNLAQGQNKLQVETAQLVQALRTPNVRGRWGEMQLKRVAELSGMLEHCDFINQQGVNTESGRLIPDMIVKLPGNKQVVVDSKCPLQAYLDSLAANTPELKQAALQAHASHVADHIAKLSMKAYWEQFPDAPEFVVLFLPGETFFSAALEANPKLIELGVTQKVILATPTTLIALLRAVAYGWQQDQLNQNVKAICEIGKQACERARLVTEHLLSVGQHLGLAVKAYNLCSSSLESRLLVSLRKFKELGIGTDKDIKIPMQIDRVPVEGKDDTQLLPGLLEQIKPS